MRTPIFTDSLAIESIMFQDTSFMRELTMLFAELKKVAKTEIPESDIVTMLSSTVKNHTGMNLAFDIGFYDPCVEIPMVNKNNILVNSFIRNALTSSDGLKMIAEADGVVRGSVNLRTGKVSGIFTDMKTTVHLPLSMFTNSKFEPEEIAAITLHEVGHIFVFFEFMSRTVTTNQVLAGISKGLDNSATIEEREAVFINAKKALNLTDLDAKELAKSNNKKVSEIVVVSNIVKQTESELGSNVYDFSTWECLADQFAARHGAGRYLVTGLEKYFKGSWNISFRSTTSYLAMEALKIAMIVITPVIVSVAPLFVFVPLMMIMSDSEGDGTYDTPEARFKRIKDQVIENLKLRDLTPNDKERLTADLEAIESVLKTVNDRRQFLGALWDIISPKARRNRTQKQLQQDLEDLSVNELFIKANELKQLS